MTIEVRVGRSDELTALDLAHREARTAGARRVSLAAQRPVQGFYERQGYISRGDVFIEAGIPHILMDREL